MQEVVTWVVMTWVVITWVVVLDNDIGGGSSEMSER